MEETQENSYKINAVNHSGIALKVKFQTFFPTKNPIEDVLHTQNWLKYIEFRDKLKSVFLVDVHKPFLKH